jgi:DNA polymerase-3 subunit delta
MKSKQRSSETSLKGALEELKRGQAACCYLLYGDEEYLLKISLDRLLDALLPSADRDLNLFVMEGGREDVGLICETLQTAPLIPSRKIVLVRNTGLFHSRQTATQQGGKVKQHLEKDPVRAARTFLALISEAGWTLEDLKDGGWKKIPAEDLDRIFGRSGEKDYERWLPQLIDFCISHDISVGKMAAETGMLEKLLQSGLPNGHHLILTAESVDRRKSLFKIIQEVGCILEFSPIKGTERQKQVIMAIAGPLMAEHKKRLSPAAWLALERKTGLDIRQATAAIEKLIAYTGDRQNIEASDVDDIIGKTKEDRLFDLTTALASKNLNDCLLSLRDLLDQGEQPLLILSMIGREIRLLLHAHILHRSNVLGSWRANMEYAAFQKAVYPKIRELAESSGNGAGSLIGQHPYVVFQALKNSGAFSFDALVDHLDNLVAVDIACKTTAQDPVALLERFIIKVCGPRS